MSGTGGAIQNAREDHGEPGEKGCCVDPEPGGNCANRRKRNRKKSNPPERWRVKGEQEILGWMREHSAGNKGKEKGEGQRDGKKGNFQKEEWENKEDGGRGEKGRVGRRVRYGSRGERYEGIMRKYRRERRKGEKRGEDDRTGERGKKI